MKGPIRYFDYAFCRTYERVDQVRFIKKIHVIKTSNILGFSFILTFML